jgi:hypothetical protein
MQQGRNLFQTVMLYARLAFPNDRAVMDLFGQPQYRGVRSNHLKLPLLLRSAFTQVSKPEYKQALLAKGLKEAEIALLDSLAGAIIAQGDVQQNAKKARLRATNQRIIAMNVVGKRCRWCAVVPNCCFTTTLPDTTYSVSSTKSPGKETNLQRRFCFNLFQKF